MAKAVLTTKIDPTYDDLPEQRYHFPRTYLRQVEATFAFTGASQNASSSGVIDVDHGLDRRSIRRS